MSLRFFFRKLRYLWKFDFTKDLYRNYLGFSPNPQLLSALPAGNIIILAPHPDDETIGVGGSILKKNKNARCTLLITSNNDETRLREARDVSKLIGINDVIVMELEKQRDEFRSALNTEAPSIIFAPNPLENHPDHLRCTDILLDASINDGTEIYFYEVWTPFIPNILVDISDTLENKLDALRMYRSQLKDKDYVSAIEGLARYRALFAPVKCMAAEAFFKLSYKDFQMMMNWKSNR